MNKQHLYYLLRSVTNLQQDRVCPFCGSKELATIDRKYLVTALLSCAKCGLSHRHPKDDATWMTRFYQSDYDIDVAMMTKLPSKDELEVLKSTCFPKLRSYDSYIQALFPNREPHSIKVIDYGCSWGYNVFKLIQSGFHAFGFEISVPRAKFGKENLQVPIFSNTEELPHQMDLILSSHVIEHLPKIQDFISLSKNLLKPDGIFMAFCPNGSQAYAEREPAIHHVNWGEIHPNYLTCKFAQFAFKDNPYLILTDDWVFDTNLLASWDGRSQTIGDSQSGKELLIIAKPNVLIR